MQDIDIGRTMPGNKAIKAIPWFLREHPMPMIPNPESTEETPLPDVPKYTNKEWFTKVIFDYGKREIKAGRNKMLQEAGDPSDLEGLFI